MRSGVIERKRKGYRQKDRPTKMHYGIMPSLLQRTAE